MSVTCYVLRFFFYWRLNTREKEQKNIPSQSAATEDNDSDEQEHDIDWDGVSNSPIKCFQFTGNANSVVDFQNQFEHLKQAKRGKRGSNYEQNYSSRGNRGGDRGYGSRGGYRGSGNRGNYRGSYKKVYARGKKYRKHRGSRGGKWSGRWLVDSLLSRGNKYQLSSGKWLSPQFSLRKLLSNMTYPHSALPTWYSRGNKYQLMTKSRPRDGTEPAVFVREVAKQHDVFAGAITSGVLVSARASFWLDKKIRKLFKYFNEDLPKPALVPTTGWRSEHSWVLALCFYWTKNDLSKTSLVPSVNKLQMLFFSAVVFQGKFLFKKVHRVRFKGATSRMAHLEKIGQIFQVCHSQSSPSSTVLVSVWILITSGVFLP